MDTGVQSPALPLQLLGLCSHSKVSRHCRGLPGLPPTSLIAGLLSGTTLVLGLLPPPSPAPSLSLANACPLKKEAQRCLFRCTTDRSGQDAELTQFVNPCLRNLSALTTAISSISWVGTALAHHSGPGLTARKRCRLGNPVQGKARHTQPLGAPEPAAPPPARGEGPGAARMRGGPAAARGGTVVTEGARGLVRGPGRGGLRRNGCVPELSHKEMLPPHGREVARPAAVPHPCSARRPQQKPRSQESQHSPAVRSVLQSHG
ncbi:uncharacterized protein AAEQ78_010843 [Lycaon pictus]